MARQTKLTPTTKSIDDLFQLYREGRLDLEPDYQRNSVWPPKARAYLVDTVLMDRPIPMLFLFKHRDPNTNRMNFRVIDGQQRLRAVFAFLENRFRTTETQQASLSGKRFKRLPQEAQDQFMSYSFVVMELLGYTEDELRDIFARINKYVVPLNQQELRDAQHPGPFKDYVDETVEHPVWGRLNLFSGAAEKRKRDKEFIAELTVLMLEGPQDKKGSVDLYFSATPAQFDEATGIRQRLTSVAETAFKLIGDGKTIFHKLPAFYGLMGALFNILNDDDGSLRENIESSELLPRQLAVFADLVNSLPVDPNAAQELAETSPDVGLAYRFRESISRQTDNVHPRSVRIQAVQTLIEGTL